MKTRPIVALCIVSVVLGFAVPFPGRAMEPRSASLKQKLVDLEKQSWVAWQEHDGKFFKNFLADDHVEIGRGGLTGKASVVAGVASGVCQVKSYQLDQFELRLLGDDVALLTYHETQETTCGGQAVPTPCWVSSLYMKRDARWLNVLYQQTQALE